MRLVIQRSKEASVTVSNKVVGQINEGLVILVGFTDGDNEKIIDKMISKVINLRIFDDENGIMNRSLLDVAASILSVSQFTLYADTRKGRRPSYIKALRGEEAIILYDKWNENLRKTGINIESGIFGADMKVALINDGPITIFMDSEE